MDSQGGGGNNNAGAIPSAIPSAEQRTIRSKLFIERANQFRPFVREQLHRLGPQSSWFRYFDKDWDENCASMLLICCATYNRYYNDAESRYIVQRANAANTTNFFSSFALDAVAFHFCWRGRRALRFPFYKPRAPPTLSWSARPRQFACWHFARFMAYSFMSYCASKPLAAAFLATETARLLKDMEPDGVPPIYGDGAASSEPPDVPLYAQTVAAKQSIRIAAQSGWDDLKNEAASARWGSQGSDEDDAQAAVAAGLASQRLQQRPHATTSNDGDSGLDSLGLDSNDGDDDASPTASQRRSNQSPSEVGGGDAWSRLRQQSAMNSQQPRQPPPGQQQQRPLDTTGDWGNSDDDADKAAQEKAQREFDRLVEQDRKGDGSERGWEPKK